MDKTADLELRKSPDDRFWFLILGTLSVFWLVGYVIYWSTWNYFIGAIGVLASLAGIPGALCWLIAALLLRSRRMLVVAVSMGCLSMLVLNRTGEMIKAHVALAFNEGSFLSTIDDIQAKPNEWVDMHNSSEIAVDLIEGQPIVAFDLGGGYMGNYPRIVNDPRGLIRTASYGENVSGLPFDGQYHSVLHLRGPWYYAYLFPD